MIRVSHEETFVLLYYTLYIIVSRLYALITLLTVKIELVVVTY